MKTVGLKIVGIIVIAVIILQFNVVIAATKSELNASSSETDKKIEEAKEQLEGIQSEKSETMKQVEELTYQISEYQNQIDDLVSQIYKQIEKNERTLITTLTIRMAEELSGYLKNLDIKVAYLHNEIKSLERMQIIHDLRVGKYDVVVGINLLREGIDVPEVSLIAIMDADKQGFLRSERSLIQTIGRAARNENGRVIMYADEISSAMDAAIKETNRRRKIQEEYNKKHGIIPKTIIKEVREVISNKFEIKDKKEKKLNKKDKERLMFEMESEMKEAAKNLDFERAMELRDALFEMQSE